MSIRRMLACLALVVAHSPQAQEPAWPITPQIEAAARSLVAPPAPQRRSVTHKRLADDLQDALAQSGADQLDTPQSLRIRLRSSTHANSIIDQVKALGGQIEAQADLSLYAHLPLRALPALLRNTAITHIARQAVLSPTAAGTGRQPDTGAGKVARNAQGVRVGIIDFGFADYAALQSQGQVPAPLASRSLIAGESDVFSGGTHGSEVARLIHQMAPDAALLLARIGGSEGQFIAATQWLREQGVQLINVSAAGYASPLDGSAAIDRRVDQLAQAGITTIAAAGNHAQLHWQGRLRDSNRNGWLDVADTANDTRHALGDFIAIEITRSGPLNIVLNWSPWPGAATQTSRNDLDALLYRVDADGNTTLVSRSETAQRGDTPPLEIVNSIASPGLYLLGLRANRLAVPGKAHVFVSGAARILPAIAEGSVGSPGTARRAITVGATDAAGMPSAFSGRGPTDDGRSKPDQLRATAAPGSGAFTGTSAAAARFTAEQALRAGKSLPPQ